MPAAFASQGYALRPAGAADAAFERILFETARPDAAFLAAWPDDVRKPFLDQQFHFQSVHYARSYPQAFRGIVLARDEPVGRLILDRGPDEWCVVDIALMPAWRRRGLGHALIEAIQTEAARARARVALMVDMSNPARRLYARLGFAVTAETPPNLAMVWQPAS
jgi:ribosomal protein S18 acetylase RimI-like enzyme